MDAILSPPASQKISCDIQITGSKSETNRLLLLQALFANLEVTNLSNSDDAQVMEAGLKIIKGVVDIHHAGTAMRFLTSYFASKPGVDVVLTGSPRMTQRPIKILVDALRDLGAQISYEGQEGFPPLRIVGTQINNAEVTLPANISSQYISSLCLIAPSLSNGLIIKLVGTITSIPYLKMTLSLLNQLGIDAELKDNTIIIKPLKEIKSQSLVVESDWSSASYWYSLVALAQVGSSVKIGSYKENSLQGDAVLKLIYDHFGVQSSFDKETLVLNKVKHPSANYLELDLANAPDIAQTIAVTCLGLGMGCYLKGLHTLPIKETDRLAAMKAELEKFGAVVRINNESLQLEPCANLNDGVLVATYNDHRMAMAFAPLALKSTLTILDAGVVSKSYPDFWGDMMTAGLGVVIT